jgi:WS/DGAT/MGAT family acyltransferase
LREAPRLLDPHRVGDAFTQLERTGAIANKLLLGPHPHTPFSGTPGVAKQVAWCDTFPLEDVKRVGRAAGATVNDVLVAAVAGALRTYTIERGGTPQDVGTMVPVNVRPLDRPLPVDLGNQFALVLLRLPIAEESPFARIAETKRRMDVIKHSPEVFLTFELIKGIGRSGPELERFFVDFFAAKAIGVTTNVPGPRQERFLAGSRIARVMSWPPESGDQTLGISIFSYAGDVQVGFRVDTEHIPDPERLVAAFEAEITELTRFAHAV